jgi:signal transduction histidine kinase
MFHAIARLHVCFTLDDKAGAARAAEAVRATAASLIGMQWSVQFEFFNAMRLAAVFDELPAHARAAALDDIGSACRSLALLAQSAPENYKCFGFLLDAEQARVTGRALDALDCYERAVACADEGGHVQQQALANERCGRFFSDRGNRKVAALYLQAAVEHYARWGAHAKVRRMRARHGTLLGTSGGVLAPEGRARLPAPDATLDVATLGKVALAIGSSDEFGAAPRQMLATAIQTSGASHGVLIEVRDDHCLVIAEGGADSADVVLLQGVPAHQAPLRCSPQLVEEALRTGREIVLSGAALDERCAADAYLATVQPKAVLCVPAMHQGRTAALLYLENQFARDAFGADRVQVIRILAAQTAISLASTRLLERMRAEMTERQRAEQQLRAIDQGLATTTGSDFFRVLVRNVAQALQVRYAFVAECLHLDGADGPAGGIARARAFWCGDDFGPSFEYKLTGTPCLQVIEGGVCHFANDLQRRFPEDVGLVRWQAESYVGMPLLDASEKVIGHLVVIDTQPMPDSTLAVALLRLSAGRAGAELQRLKADEGLQRALAEVEELKNRLQEENVYLRRELIANVSHDLRSPLASLRGYLETLLIKKDSLSEADRHSYLTIALRQAEQLQVLISELFDLARLDFDGYRIAAEPLHLGELARDVAQRFHLAAANKGVGLLLDVDDRVSLVQADIALIERTIANLLDNALAHTPPGGRVRLAVKAGAQDVSIDVSDTGIGIPAGDLPRIFERFYRVDKARSLDKSGSGLGLAIVKRIVELHGSEIRVASEVGAGTRFWFALPQTR